MLVSWNLSLRLCVLLSHTEINVIKKRFGSRGSSTSFTHFSSEDANTDEQLTTSLSLIHHCWLLVICTSAWKPETTQINGALCPIGEAFNYSPQKMLLRVIHLCEPIRCKGTQALHCGENPGNVHPHPGRPPVSSWWVCRRRGDRS